MDLELAKHKNEIIDNTKKLIKEIIDANKKNISDILIIPNQIQTIKTQSETAYHFVTKINGIILGIGDLA